MTDLVSPISAPVILTPEELDAWTQIAEELRLPEGTIKSRLHRATKELQRRMGR